MTDETQTTNGKINRWVFSITAALVLVLFLSAFILSYEALRNLALDNGIQKGLGFLWPLGLDAFMAVASLYLLWAHLNRTWEPLPLALVMVATGASVVFNVAHAPPTNMARAVAALPPLVAFMAFEVFIIMVRESTERSTVGTTLGQLRAELAQLTGQVDQEKDQLRTLRSQSRSLNERIKTMQTQAKELERVTVGSNDPVAVRRGRLRTILAENGREWTNNELAEELGVSLTTLKRDRAALEKGANNDA